MNLSECISVAPRYSRAINLERDLHSEVAVQGYVLTSTGLDCIARIADAVDRPSSGTAWTLTGPYGTGKSAFALYITRLLGNREDSKEARKLLQNEAPQLFHRLFSRKTVAQGGFCPIVVSASSEPLATSILSSSIRDLRRFAGRRTLKSVRELEQLHKRGEKVPSKRVTETLKEAVLELRRIGLASGVLLVVDELGKALEHAARASTDIFILQELAESAASFQEPGLLLLTLLHQSFEQYAAGLRSSVRNDWAKIQGRFVDIAFQDPPEQVLHILANAIRQKPCAKVNTCRSAASAIAGKMSDAAVAPSGFGKKRFSEIAAALAPIHPVTALCLTHLCRKFGQNQRSLFAFLLSREPNGFLGFLERDRAGELFGPARLYDYIISSFGSGALMGDGAARWAETQSILQQRSDLDSSQQEIVKTVGLLTSIGTYGNLLPNSTVLRMAVIGSDYEKDLQGAGSAVNPRLQKALWFFRTLARQRC
jgi:hypothetical protein